MGRKILVIDDDADDRDLFAEALQEIDGTLECVSAKNGYDAIKILANDTGTLPDYIFLDLNMPRMGGKQCLAQLKNFPHCRDIPVVIFTTSKLRDDIEEIQQLGAIGYITKPPRFSELVAQLTVVLNSQYSQVH